MFKKFLGLFFVVMIFINLSATSKTMNLRAGFLVPNDANTGFIGGLCYGTKFDESVSLFFSTDYFYRNYSKIKKIGFHTSSGGNNVSEMRKSADITNYYLPLMGNLQVNFPLQDRIGLYGGVGIGYGLLWENVFVAANEEEGTEKIDDVKFYSGFNWNISAGAKTGLGRNSSLYGEVFYNGGIMKRNLKADDFGVTWDQIDMSGIGMRIGIELRY